MQLLLTMALRSRWTDLATERLQANPSNCIYTLSFWNSTFTESLLTTSFPFSNGFATSLLSSCVKIVVIGNGQMWFLYSKGRLLAQHIQKFLQVWPGPFPFCWQGLGTMLGLPDVKFNFWVIKSTVGSPGNDQGLDNNDTQLLICFQVSVDVVSILPLEEVHSSSPTNWIMLY